MPFKPRPKVAFSSAVRSSSPLAEASRERYGGLCGRERRARSRARVEPVRWALGRKVRRRGGARAVVREDAKLVAELRRVLGGRLEHKGELAQPGSSLVAAARAKKNRCLAIHLPFASKLACSCFDRVVVGGSPSAWGVALSLDSP